MPYVTLPLAPVYRQLTFEELLRHEIDVSRPVYTNESNTRTYFTDAPSDDLVRKANVPHLVRRLEDFRQTYDALYRADRKTLFHTFPIPKKSGGLRRIDAPVPELMDALRILKRILENAMPADHHTAAFAYVRGRSTVDAVRRHQRNDSWWFAKYDFSDFFGSTNKEFAVRMLRQLFPFHLVGEELLADVLDLCFLNGKLPQGTPISPLLTNLVMIPLDYGITKALAEDESHQWIYTRYADDILISSRVGFDVKYPQSVITGVVRKFDAPYRIKSEKTRYGSRAGANWNLGLMLNKDNAITIGHKTKERFRAMVHSYMMDRRNGKPWPLHDIQTLHGHFAYYEKVEGAYTKKLKEHYREKLGQDPLVCMLEDLR